MRLFPRSASLPLLALKSPSRAMMKVLQKQTTSRRNASPGSPHNFQLLAQFSSRSGQPFEFCGTGTLACADEIVRDAVTDRSVCATFVQTDSKTGLALLADRVLNSSLPLAPAPGPVFPRRMKRCSHI